MPFDKIWVHIIWSTKNREPVLDQQFRGRVLDHIRENAQKKEIFLDTINGVSDHLHALISLRSDQTVAKIAQLLKGESSYWINKENLTLRKCEWQDEYIAVPVSDSAVQNVREYIKNQEEHHRKKTFSEEYNEFISRFDFK